MQKLLILEEQPVMRVGIAAAVEAAGLELSPVGVGSTGDAIEALRKGGWAAAVVDTALAEAGGISFLGRLAKTHPNLPVLVFTAMPETPYGLRVLGMGAAGFLNKDASPQTLCEAVERVASGHRYVSPSLAEQLADRFLNDSDRLLHELLTDRELEVFRLIALGNATAEIAESLNISPKTVHVHRSNILRKTGLADNRELTSYAFEHGLIPGRREADQGEDGARDDTPT